LGSAALLAAVLGQHLFDHLADPALEILARPPLWALTKAMGLRQPSVGACRV
jgi:hypothetical protein